MHDCCFEKLDMVNTTQIDRHVRGGQGSIDPRRRRLFRQIIARSARTPAVIIAPRNVDLSRHSFLHDDMYAVENSHVFLVLSIAFTEQYYPLAQNVRGSE
jgi:succinylarginine dihydrolase